MIFTLLFSSQLKYKEIYEKNKAQINIAPDAFEIRAAKEAYKNISNVSWLPATIWACLSFHKKCA